MFRHQASFENLKRKILDIDKRLESIENGKTDPYRNDNLHVKTYLKKPPICRDCRRYLSDAKKADNRTK